MLHALRSAISSAANTGGVSTDTLAVIVTIVVVAVTATWVIANRMGRTEAKVDTLTKLLDQHLREGHGVPRP